MHPPSQVFSSDVVLLAYCLVACVHLFALVSEDHCNFVLCMTKLIVDNCQGDVRNTKPLSASIPADTRTVVHHLDLDPQVRRYVTCPKCSCLYKLPSSDDDPPIPERCTFSAVPNGNEPPCQERLRKEAGGDPRTSESFYQEFHCRDVLEWVAELLCRIGNEEKLDRNPYSRDGLQRDIWDGTVLRTFADRDGQGLFVPDSDAGQDKTRASEGRYVFGFCWDGFNPFGNKQAGKKVTCGAMYLICYNFPIEERFLPENILLFGIIPGPDHRSKEQLNCFLAPLVDDLEVLWERGMFVTATPTYPNGRSIKGALVPIIADLPAIRQATGHSGISSTFMCSFCWLRCTEINSLDKSHWRRKSATEHRRLATSWNKATSAALRKDLYKQHGVRHSEFLRLPYWNPVECVCIDSMHMFYMGNLHNHCRRIWGFSHTIADEGDSPTPVTDVQTTNLPSDKEMAEGLRAFDHGSAKDLQKQNKNVLYHLCLKFECLPEERLQNRIACLRGSLVHFVSLTSMLSDSCERTHRRNSACSKDGSQMRIHLALPRGFAGAMTCTKQTSPKATNQSLRRTSPMVLSVTMITKKAQICVWHCRPVSLSKT